MLARKDRQIQKGYDDALSDGVTTTDNTDVMNKLVSCTRDKVNLKEGEVNLIGSLKEAEYNDIDLDKMVMEGESYNHLNVKKKLQLLQMLEQPKPVFHGVRMNYIGGEVTISLKDDANPFWGKPYRNPLKNREIVEKGVHGQCDIGALRELSAQGINEREWAFPAFGIPNKNDEIMLVMEFRMINSQLNQKQFLFPIIEVGCELIIHYLGTAHHLFFVALARSVIFCVNRESLSLDMHCKTIAPRRSSPTVMP